MKKLRRHTRKTDLPRADEMACLFERFVHWPEQFASKRKRRYTHEGTFWLFLGQVLCMRASCQEVVARFLSRLALCAKPTSASNAAYCKARKRLPRQALEQVYEDINAKANLIEPTANRWRGRNVKVVDGSSVSMPDTRQNQARYPQPKAQKEGCGFPVMRLVVLFSLGAGTVLAYAKGALCMHERILFHDVWACLEKTDILLADRGFCSYADFCLLLERSIDCVMRKHARRGKTSVTKKRLVKTTCWCTGTRTTSVRSG